MRYVLPNRCRSASGPMLFRNCPSSRLRIRTSYRIMTIGLPRNILRASRASGSMADPLSAPNIWQERTIALSRTHCQCLRSSMFLQSTGASWPARPIPSSHGMTRVLMRQSLNFGSMISTVLTGLLFPKRRLP